MFATFRRVSSCAIRQVTESSGTLKVLILTVCGLVPLLRDQPAFFCSSSTSALASLVILIMSGQVRE